MPSYYNKVKYLVAFVFVFIFIVFLLPLKILAYTSPADCKTNVQCDSSQCPTANDRYCTGFFPDGAPCTYHESCTVSGNPSCNCSGKVGSYTYTLSLCSDQRYCTGVLGPNGSSTTCKYCQTPLCTPGETDTRGCTTPAGCTANRTCQSNYEWGACSVICPPTCICPNPSDVDCGVVSNTPTNSPCSGTCSYVVGTKACPTPTPTPTPAPVSCTACTKPCADRNGPGTRSCSDGGGNLSMQHSTLYRRLLYC